MSKTNEDILKDTRMLTRVMQQALNKNTKPCEEEELSAYLTMLLNKEKKNQKNALMDYQNKQIRQNIQSQIKVMKRYQEIK